MKVVVKGPQLVKAYPSVVVMVGIVPSKFKPDLWKIEDGGMGGKKGNNSIVLWFCLVLTCSEMRVTYAEVPETLTDPWEGGSGLSVKARNRS